jgi:hypothetical protein
MSWQGRVRFGVCGGFGAGSSIHRPSVAFGAHRASAPARRPAATWCTLHSRVASVASGRLDGLLAGCDALLRYALPEGAPLENVPMQPRSVCGTFSRTARPPLRPNPFSVSRVREPGTAERESTGLGSERDRRMPGTRPWCLRRQALPMRDSTCSSEPLNLGRREAREEAHLRRGGFGAHGAVPGARRSLPGPTRRATFSAAPGSATRVSENLVWQQRPWACFSETPACRRVRMRLRFGSPPGGGVSRFSCSSAIGHLRLSRWPSWWLQRAVSISGSR